MIAKKNKKANLERKRFAFFQIGLLVAGSLVLAAFEYSTVAVDGKQVTYLDAETPTFDPNDVQLDDFKIPEEKKKQPPVVNPEHVDSFVVREFIPEQGDVKFDNKGKITIDDDFGDIYGDIGMGIAEEDGAIIDVAEIDPSFVGGEAAMMKWMQNEIEYPQLCAEMGIGGTVYVQFVVNTNGSICQVKNVSNEHEDLTAEAMRVVRKMPKWIPGEQAGKKVRVRYTIPIKFESH